MANLLIVDDELGMRQFLTHLFQREGHDVRVAENGRGRTGTTTRNKLLTSSFLTSECPTWTALNCCARRENYFPMWK